MNTPLLRCMYASLLLAGLALAWPALAQPTPAASLFYPLAGIRSQADLDRLAMSGGSWCAGLPGRPRYNGTHAHAGVDLRARQGEPVIAMLAGVVDARSDAPHNGYGPGWTVGGVMIVRSVLPDNTPCLVIYGHTQNHRVQGGQPVRAGEMLAEVGPWLETEGGPHLHLTVRLGDLPRFGWGTPTLPGTPLRPGAECAANEEAVLALGYRNPLDLLRGQGVRGATVAIGQNEIPTARFQALFQAYCQELARTQPGRLPLAPAREGVLGTDQPVRWGQAWVQTVRDARGTPGAIIWLDGNDRVYEVVEPLWSVYAQHGGISRLGPPLREPYLWGDCVAQSFAGALIVCQTAGGQSWVIARPTPESLTTEPRTAPDITCPVP